MRNIEEIAAEEEARVREERRRLFQKLAFLAAGILSPWGWLQFSKGSMEEGAFLVLLSLGSFLSAWGGFSFLRFQFFPAVAGAFAGLAVFIFYRHCAAPSFGWGQDPAFWLTIHAGVVPEPPWTPLPVLLGQAACFLFPGSKFSLLPLLSAGALALSLFFVQQDYHLQLRRATTQNTALGIAVCLFLSLGFPFWDAGTLASGLPASLGLLLFLFQRFLLNMEKRSWPALWLLVGLLTSVHPLWGFLGLIRHVGSLERDRRGHAWGSFALLVGLSPYLWILLRAGKTFPSWGGEEPFKILVQDGGGLLRSVGAASWNLGPALLAQGWVVGALLVVVLFLGGIQFFWRKQGLQPLLKPLDLWIGVLAGAGGILFYSAEEGTPGMTSLWFAVGLGAFFLRLLRRGTEKRQTGPLVGKPLLLGSGILGLLAVGAAGISGQTCFRQELRLPLQHAYNLLRTLPESPKAEDPLAGPRVLMILRDPFEAAAVREARLHQPFRRGALLLEERYLDRKWMVLQCMQWAPDLLFSSIEGKPQRAIGDLVLNNIDRWEIHWAVSVLPADWDGPPALPAVLTQRFEGPAVTGEAGNGQFHYDLTELLALDRHRDRWAARYLARYTEGFNEMGLRLQEKERYSTAIQALERAVKLDPAYTAPQERLAGLFSQEHILEAARLNFERILKEHPKAIERRIAQAARQGGKEPTPRVVEDVIRMNLELAEAQYQLSKIYEKQGRAREAQALLEASLHTNPQRIEAQLELGRKMLAVQDPIRAEEAFRAVLYLDPQNKEAQQQVWKLLNRP